MSSDFDSVQRADSSVQPSQEKGNKGFALYTTSALRGYDLAVTQLSNRFVWHCPPSVITQWYQRHASPVHADIGPGTGYYLDHCGVSFKSLMLLDANTDACTFAANRLSRFEPTTQRVNILSGEQVAHVAQRFDSVGLNYVLHCLPGSLQREKVGVLGSLAVLLNPGGVLFGATLLADLPHTGLARALSQFYNARGVFGNSADTVPGLTQALHAHFRDVQIETQGSVALFAARRS